MDYSYSTDPYMQPADPFASIGFMLGMLVFSILVIIAYWKIFEKAGQPGWAAVIPIYNIYVLLQVVKKPGWWLILYFIPFVNIVIHIIVSLDLAKVFKKDGVFGIFLNFLFAPIGQLILGFGKAKYSK